MAVGEALRRLCEEIGWSYAVFWKAIGAADPVHLVWEDGCCGHSSCLAGSEASEARSSEAGREASGNLCSLVKKVMVSQVHVVGEGIVGRAAFTGNHRWIVGSAGNDDGFERKAAAELNYQFQAGIQTIAIIPVLPRGVLQLGSTSVVMENTAFVLHAKKLCSQLNNRSSMAVSASVKNEVSQQGQPHTLHGVPSIRSADTYSKVLSGFPMAYEQCRGPDTTAAPSSISTTAEMDASLLNITQQNSRAVREHFLFSKPDVRFIRQAPYWDGRLGSNTQSVIMSSGFTSSSLAVVENQSFLTTSIGQLESGNSAESEVDLPRNVLLTSAVCQSPVQENTNIIPLHGTDVVSDCLNCNGKFDFLPSSARVVRTSLYNVAQVLERRHNSTSGASLQKQPLVPCKVPRAAQFALKMENPERESFQAPAASSSEFDVQVSCSGLSMGTAQENQLSSSNLICHDKRVEVNDSIAAVSMQGMKNMDGCKLPDVSNERSCLLPLEPTTENDLFDILGPEFHQLCRNVDADLFSWNDARTQISDRDAPESSMYVDTSQVFDSLDNELPYSRTSLTDTDQLLDAVISNINLGGKQNCDDSASCKTSLTDMPSTSYVGSKELKQCGSSGVPSLLVKNELAVPNFVKQPCFFDRAEDGCLSQNNGMQKSQIRLWIESGQNMKCESGSASNSKGLDTPNKANRKRSRSGENPRPRPKDRQLIQDRIKELREIVPNGAKCSTDALLEKTIKHMLFLQSVTKHADKLKDSTESKILGGENGPLWKDYFEGGVTWAFEVGSQSMTCPIIVEDLDRPRQMLVEILCEDRGIFLEIADFIRGLGLTILRGVMEARKSKIWARFTVEANRDVTRMEIFLSLVRLLEPNCGSSGAAQNANNVNMPLGMVHQPVIPATGISDCLR